MKRATQTEKVQTWFRKVFVFPFKCLFYSIIYDKRLYWSGQWKVDLMTPFNRSVAWWKTMIFHETNLRLLTSSSRGQKAWCRYGGRIWSLAWLGTPCIFDRGSASMHIWGSCISPQGSPARTIPRCCSHTSDGDVQWIHELCSSVSGVAVWRHFKLF